MTTFNAIPSEQAGMLFQALKEDREVTVTYEKLVVELMPQKNTEMATVRFTRLPSNGGVKVSRVTLKRHDALAVICALFEGVKCQIRVEDE